jgi:hypothetical protein
MQVEPLVIPQTGLWLWALPDWVEWCSIWEMPWYGLRFYDVPSSTSRPVDVSGWPVL